MPRVSIGGETYDVSDTTYQIYRRAMVEVYAARARAGNQNPVSPAARKIIAGLIDALEYVQGNESRATIHTIGIAPDD
jgi:hypothetical protein